MYLVSVLVPIPSADALVSLLTAHEELSPSPALIPGVPAAPVGKVWGEAQLCGVFLRTAAVGFFHKQILLLFMRNTEGPGLSRVGGSA